MLENLAARVNGDANLVRRGKHVTTTFLIAIDSADHLVSVSEGRITGIRPGPFITPNYSFALRASRDAWEKLLVPKPIPGFTDIFALVKKKLLRIEGDLHPFMSNLLYFKGVLAAAGAAPNEPALRTGHRPLSASRPAREAAPSLCGGSGQRHPAALPAHRRLRRAAVSRLAQRSAHHQELPRDRVRHAVARQILATRRLGERGIPPHLARLCAHDPRSLRRAGTRQARRDGLLDRRAHRAASRARAPGEIPRHRRAGILAQGRSLLRHELAASPGRARRRSLAPASCRVSLRPPRRTKAAGKHCGTTCRAVPACSRATSIST